MPSNYRRNSILVSIQCKIFHRTQFSHGIVAGTKGSKVRADSQVPMPDNFL